MADKTKDKPNYSYVRIADLKTGVYSVFGVVKFSKVPVQSRGTDFVQVLSITDESLAEGDKLVITLFYSNVEDFPKAVVGDVIRFHRLRVESVNGELKGRPGPGFSWLLVHKDVDNPSLSSQKFTYNNLSKQRVEQLQQWSRKQGWWKETRSAGVTLSGLAPSQYCDLVCQVVGTALKKDTVCFVARVWDGTLCPFKTVDMDEQMDTDPALVKVAGDLTVDIWIYDDHVPSCQGIRPGQFIKLNNLHAAVYKIKGDDANPSVESSPTLELVLHRGTAFGRRVVLLAGQSPLVAPVRQRMDRCLSVVCSHQHISSTPLGEVLRGPVPGKFRVLAHLVDFHPNTLDPWQLVRQLCSKCNYLTVPNREATTKMRTSTPSTAKQSTMTSVTSTFTSSITSRLVAMLGGGLSIRSREPDMPELCPRCKSEGQSVSLELIYMLRLVLHDTSGHFLVANLWREQAVTFFRGVSPDVAVSQQGAVDDLVTTLRGLCLHRPDSGHSPTSSPPPQLDCCLFSYATTCGDGGSGGGGGEVNFHIFDTVLV